MRQINALADLMLSNAVGPVGPRLWMHQSSVRVHWICLISLEKVNAHLLTSNLSSRNIQLYQNKNLTT